MCYAYYKFVKMSRKKHRMGGAFLNGLKLPFETKLASGLVVAVYIRKQISVNVDAFHIKVKAVFQNKSVLLAVVVFKLIATIHFIHFKPQFIRA